MDYHENLNREVTLRTENPGGSLEISRDFILPDSYADMKKVLGVSAMPSPTGAYTDEGKAYYSGEINCQVLFLTDEGKLASLACPVSYESVAAVGKEEGKYETLFMPYLASVSARAVNPRKIGIKLRVDPSLYTWEVRDASVAFDEALTEADIATFEEKNEAFSYLSAKYVSAKGIESGDDILIDEAYLPIGEIVCTEVAFSGISAEAREGGIAVNGNANVTVLYKNEAGEPVFRSHTLPVATFAECDGVKESDWVSAMLYCEGVSCKAHENAAGEARVMELDFTYAIEGAVLSKESGVAVKDLYSTRYECENMQYDIPIASYVGKIGNEIKVMGEMPCEEKGSVLGTLSSFSALSLTKDENGNGVLDGTMYQTVFLVNPEGSVFAKTLEIPLRLATSLAFSGKPEGLLTATLNKSKTTLSGDLLSTEATVGINALCWEAKKEKMIVKSTVTAEVAGEDGSLFTVYFPSAGETSWDIAKKYRVPEDRLLISRENGKHQKRVLILPCERKAIFRGTVE